MPTTEPEIRTKLAGSDGARYGIEVAFSDQLDIDERRMSVVIPFASGVRRDSVGDLLEIGGIDTSRHRINPISLWDHGKHEDIVLPIGLCEDRDTRVYTVNLDTINKVATANVFFYQGRGLVGVEKQIHDAHAIFCEQLFDCVAKRLIRGASVGYTVKRAEPLPPDWQHGTPKGLHLLQTIMLEASIVVLPANSDTVRKSMSADPIRQILAMPTICGKAPSPVLVKSLQPYAEEAKVQMLVPESKAADDDKYKIWQRLRAGGFLTLQEIAYHSGSNRDRAKQALDSLVSEGKIEQRGPDLWAAKSLEGAESKAVGYHGPYTVAQISGGTAWYVYDNENRNVAGPFLSRAEAESKAREWEEVMGKSLDQYGQEELPTGTRIDANGYTGTIAGKKRTTNGWYYKITWDTEDGRMARGDSLYASDFKEKSIPDADDQAAEPEAVDARPQAKQIDYKALRAKYRKCKAVNSNPYTCKVCGYQVWNTGGRKRHENDTGHRGWTEDVPAKSMPADPHAHIKSLRAKYKAGPPDSAMPRKPKPDPAPVRQDTPAGLPSKVRVAYPFMTPEQQAKVRGEYGKAFTDDAGNTSSEFEIREGRKVVRVSEQNGKYTARLYLDNGDLPSGQTWKGGTEQGARDWAKRVLAKSYAADATESRDDLDNPMSRGNVPAAKWRPGQGAVKSLSPVRLKYRSAKNYRRKLRKSCPGASVIRVHEKDIAGLSGAAEQAGLKWQRVGSEGGLEKVKLVGDDDSIDRVAQKFGA